MNKKQFDKWDMRVNGVSMLAMLGLMGCATCPRAEQVSADPVASPALPSEPKRLSLPVCRPDQGVILERIRVRCARGITGLVAECERQEEMNACLTMLSDDDPVPCLGHGRVGFLACVEGLDEHAEQL